MRFGSERTSEGKFNNSPGPGRGNTNFGKKPKSYSGETFEPVEGSTPEEVVNLNAAKFLNWAFKEAGAGNERMQGALISKLVNDRLMKNEGSKGLPDFAKLSNAEIDAEIKRLEGEGL